MRPFTIDTDYARHLARDLHAQSQGENPPHPVLPEDSAFTAFNEAVHTALDNVGARMSVLRNDMGQVAHSGFRMSREAEDTDAALGQHLGAAM